VTTNAIVTSSPITAAVSGGSAITANVGSSTVSSAVSGGIGPQGPAGPQGIPGDSLSAASDVQLSNVAAGDLLRYGNGGKWQNFPESNLVIDGQNF
jgi:hypothetical protein